MISIFTLAYYTACNQRVYLLTAHTIPCMMTPEFVEVQGRIMAQKCEITGKGKQFGHNVPFSQKRTKKVWKPNLQKKTFMLEGKKVTMKLSTQAIRTLRKKGVL